MIGAMTQEMNYLMESITDAIYHLPTFLKTKIRINSMIFLKTANTHDSIYFISNELVFCIILYPFCNKMTMSWRGKNKFCAIIA